MHATWKMASMMVLSLSVTLAGVGCVAQTEDQDPAEPEATSAGDAIAGDAVAGEAAQQEQTGTAHQACGFGGYGAYGGYGFPGYGYGFPSCGTPFPGYGFGFPHHCGGFGFGDWD